MIGQSVAHYRITDKLGAGGMGEVYRATDTRLNRQVALKFLPEELCADPIAHKRFLREARSAAALDHPYICRVFEVTATEDEGTDVIVMEYVEGETLQARLDRGPLSLKETLKLGSELAEALESAHARGIVHRDLKPSNIMLTPTGHAKVMDFGLAKRLIPEGADTQDISSALTGTGAVLGTLPYMSPEHIRGRAVDHRADIFSLGIILYEALAGVHPFRRSQPGETAGAILKEDPPPLSRYVKEVPELLRHTVDKMLAKDPTERFQSVHEVLTNLQRLREDSGKLEPVEHKQVGWMSSRLWLIVLAGLLGAILGGFFVWKLQPVPSRAVTRFTITLPQGQQLAQTEALALSPDGSQIAYVATAEGGGQRQIYLYSMETGRTRPISGTEGAQGPFFSPDGQSLGFASTAELKQVSLKGGAAQSLTDFNRSFHGASWSSEHTIAFAPYSSALQQVSDQGGTAQALTHLESGETSHVWPRFLPGGKAVLFEAYATAPVAIGAQMIGTGERKDLIRGRVGEMPGYVPSGHLTYVQAGNLMAVPFDLKHLEVKRTTPVAVVQDVAQYSVSATGSLVYATSGYSEAGESHLVWVNGGSGREEMLPAPARRYNQPRISPDGRKVAVDILDTIENMQVWLYDFAADHLTPFTFEGVNRHAVWAPRSERIAFMSNRKGSAEIFWKLADGSGGLEQLTGGRAATELEIPYSFSSDGQLLTYVGLQSTGGAQAWVLNLKDRKAQRIPLDLSGDGAPQLSPDARWLAYVSEDSDQRWQVYVRAYPGPGGPWQISTDGGNEPQWNPSGRQLFYRNGAKMMAVDISTGAGFIPSKPRLLFEGDYRNTNEGYARANYDVSSDGRRFLMLKPVEQGQARATQINVVLNWSEELKRLVPTD